MTIVAWVFGMAEHILGRLDVPTKFTGDGKKVIENNI